MSFAARLDAFVNWFTGSGSLLDKTRSVCIERDPILQPEVCATLFQASDIARTICSAIVDDAMRQGFELEQEQDDESDDDDASTTTDEDRQLGQIARAWDVRRKIHEAAIWGRTFGGAVIWIGVDEKQSEPLEEENIVPGSVKFLAVLDRRDLTPVQFYDDESSPKFGEVMTYRIQVMTADGASPKDTTEIHETRFVKFGGALTDRRARNANQRWDYSVLQAVYSVLIDADSNWKSLVALVADFGQGVFKIKGLMQMVAAGQEDIVRARMRIVDEGRSSLRSLMLDADGEDFERKATPVAGLTDLMVQTWQRVAAAARMPVTRLMGMSPAGLNATGESDTRDWYDSVQHYRDTVLTPGIARLMNILAANEGLSVVVQVCWPSLWQMTAKEEADMRKVIADMDKVYIDGEVFLPEEIAIERSKPGPPRATLPKVNLDQRQKLLNIELQQAEADAKNPPPRLPPGLQSGSVPPQLQGANLEHQP